MSAANYIFLDFLMFVMYGVVLVLQGREIPEDDPRLLLVSRTYDNIRPRYGGGAAGRQ